MSKNRKAKLVLCIIAAISIFSVSILCFAHPYLETMFASEKKAMQALKSVKADYNKMVNHISAKDEEKEVSKKHFRGYLKLEKNDTLGSSYLDEIKVDTLTFDIKTDTANKVISGTGYLSKDGQPPVAGMIFYIEDSVCYFKIPEVFAESFTTDVTEGMDIAKSSLKVLLDGFDMSVNYCDYEKLEAGENITDEQDRMLSQYKVTLTKEAVTESMNLMINNMYNDTVLSPYLTILAQTEGITKEKVKNKVTEGLNDYTEMSYRLYLKENKIAGIKLDSEIYQGVKLIGELNIAEFEELDYTAADFENVIDLDALTVEQEDMLWDEVYENKAVIKALVTDKVIDWVQNCDL